MNPPANDFLMTPSQVAERLQVSVAWVRDTGHTWPSLNQWRRWAKEAEVVSRGLRDRGESII